MHYAFPSWRYGPNGEAQIFQSKDEIPSGWKDHPNKFKNEAVDENELETARLAVIEAQRIADEMEREAKALERELQAQTGSANDPPVPQDPPEDPKPPAAAPKRGPGRPRKVKTEAEVAAGTNADESSLLARNEALAALRDAGVEISDDATDEEVNAALDALPD